MDSVRARDRSYAVAALLVLFTLILALGVSTVPASANGAGSISGVAVSSDGTPLRGICVGLYETQALPVIAWTSTGVDGSFSFAAVADGTYSLRYSDCFASEFAPRWSSSVVVSFDSATTAPDAVMTRAGQGMVRVTTNPAVPSRISLDGITADSWGLTWLKVPAGFHTISFSGIGSFTAPSNRNISVVEGQTTVIDGVFSPRGYLKVETSPAVPATISIDGAPRNDWGVWTDLPRGSYDVCYGPVPGFDPPPCEAATVTAGATTALIGSYAANGSAPGQTGNGFLRVTTTPAVPSQIKIDGVPADTWGLTWVKIAPGQHTISFSDVPGFVTPPNQVVTVINGITTVVNGSFDSLESIRVVTSPAVAATVYVNGAPSNDWGVWTDREPGGYFVCLGYAEGFIPPACETVTITAGGAASTTLSPVADGTLPSTPSGLTPEVLDGAVRLDWNASASGDVWGYRVYQTLGPERTLLTPTPIRDLQYLDTGLFNGVPYSYEIMAVDLAGNESPAATTGDLVPTAVAKASHCGTITSDEVWDATAVHIVDCRVVVPYGFTLTVTPDAIVKLDPAASIDVYGSLDITGATGQEALFTSSRDDWAAGDTNDDGNATVPGAWGGIRGYDAASKPMSIVVDFAEVRYAGLDVSARSGSETGVNPQQSSVSVSNSRFENGSYVDVTLLGPVTVVDNVISNSLGEFAYGDGIYVSQSGLSEVLSSVTVTGNSVTGARYSGVKVEMVSALSLVEPVVSNNTVDAAGSTAVFVQAARLVPSKLVGNTGSASTVQVLSLAGTLVGDLTLPRPGLPVAIASSTFGGTGLTVDYGVTLTLNAGVVLKAVTTSNYSPLNVYGSLVVNGTVANPVIFTSFKDDTAGGDTNLDGGATTPAAGDWPGIHGYDAAGEPMSMVLDFAEVRYARLSVSATSGAETGVNPQQSSVSVTNSLFEHGSYVSVTLLGPVTITDNVISNSPGEYAYGTGIRVVQYGNSEVLSSVTVTGNSVTGAGGGGVNVRVQGTSSLVEPVVSNNTVDAVGGSAVSVQAVRLVPSKLVNNTGTASTVRVLLLAGTLVGDLTLPRPGLPVAIASSTFGGTGLTVDYGVTLTLNAGVVLKAVTTSNYSPLNVYGSLVVNGTVANPVIFTSFKDDTAGGDTNLDGNTTTPAAGDWPGIYGGDAAGEPMSMVLDFAEVRYARLSVSATSGAETGVNPQQSSVSVTNSRFEHGSNVDVRLLGPVTFTDNVISNSPGEYAYGTGIRVVQYGNSGVLSSVTVTGNSVTGAGGGGVNVRVQGTSSLVEPVVSNNTVDAVGGSAVSVQAVRLVPSKLVNNTGTASTVRVLLLAGTLVGDLTLPRPGLPVAIDNNGFGNNGLTVDYGVTLTLNAGVVLKAETGTGSPLMVYGSLVVNGTIANPVIFTSFKDDTAGGDTNLDGNTTTPAAGDWPGIYGGDAAGEPMSMVLDFAEVRYARLSVSATSGAETGVNPQQSSVSVTNSRFEHGSNVDVRLLGPVTITDNVISNSPGEYASGNGINVVQHGNSEVLSSVTVTGNSVTGAGGGGVTVGTGTLSLVEPVVSNNTVTDVSGRAVSVLAARLVPSKLVGNTGSASTVRVLLLGGTLVGDLTLPRAGLPVAIDNNGYGSNSGLTVDYGVTLTLNAGVVLKAETGASSPLNVYGSLVVNGTIANPVIFTSFKDDTAGGDTNLDGNATTPAAGDWSGIRILDSSASMTANSATVRYANTGIVTLSTSSASLTGSSLRYNSTGLYASGSSSITFRGTIVDNVQGARACGVPTPPGTPSCTVDARDVDWGTDSGPSPFGSGDSVSGAVTVVPWVGFRETEFFYFGAGSGDYAGSSSGSYADYRRYGGDPVDVVSGNFGTTFTDVSIPEPGPDLVFARAYNSMSDDIGAMGEGWTHSWETRIEDPTSTPLGTLNLIWGDGRLEAFVPLGGGVYQAPAGSFTTVVDVAGGGWEVTTKDRVTYAFDASGRLTDVTDPNGNALTVTRDGAGNPTVVTDDAGRTLTLSYTGSLLTSVTDPDGQVWSYAYTGSLLTSVTDPDGFSMTYQYDTENRITQVIDGNGNADVVNIYDLNGRVVVQKDAIGNTITFSYSDVNRKTTKTDPRGGTRVYEFDTNGRLVGETDPLGFTTIYGYDAAGNRVSETDPLGGVTTATYDADGNALTVTDSEGRVTTRTWTDNLLSTETDPRGNTTTYGYDTSRNLTSVTDALGFTTTYTRDSRGLVLTVTSPQGRVTTNTYNTQGDLVTTTDGRGNTTTFTYDAMGRVLTSTDADGGVTTFTYDGRGNQLTVTDPRGNSTSTTYDAAGNVTGVTDPLGNTTTTGYLANDLVASVTDRTGAVTTYGYDSNGNNTTITDPRSVVTSFTYDADNRAIKTTLPDGGTETRTYDAMDRVKSVTDPLGNTTVYSYDLTGLRTAVTDPNGGTTSFGYDANGNRTSRTDANGRSTTSGYDSVNRLTNRTDPLSRTWAWTYDKDGLVKTETDPSSGVTTSSYDNAGNRTSIVWSGASSTTISYDVLNRVTQRVEAVGTSTLTYDANGNVLSVTDANGATVTYTYDAGNRVVTRTTPGTVLTSYAYDAEGRLTSVTDPEGNVVYTYRNDGALTAATLPNSVSLTVIYDVNVRPTRYNYVDGAATTLFDEQLTYDAAGNVTQITDPLGTRTFTYDSVNQLTSESTAGTTTTWTYDPVGNRLTSSVGTTTVTYTYDAGDQLVSDTAGNTYAYDARGNLTSVANAANTTTYSYNTRNHLTGVISPTSTITRTVTDGGTPLATTIDGTATTHIYDQLAPTGSALIRNTTGATVSRTLWGLAPYAQSGSSLLVDHIGSIRVNWDGAAPTPFDYDAWGNPLTTTPTSLDPSWAEGTQLGDLVHLGQRLYDPTTGRFLTAEPRLNNEQPWASLYTYARNRPLLRVDSSGLDSTFAWNIRQQDRSISLGLTLGVHRPTTGSSYYSRARGRARGKAHVGYFPSEDRRSSTKSSCGLGFSEYACQNSPGLRESISNVRNNQCGNRAVMNTTSKVGGGGDLSKSAASRAGGSFFDGLVGLLFGNNIGPAYDAAGKVSSVYEGGRAVQDCYR